jgi:hypothetical protein
VLRQYRENPDRRVLASGRSQATKSTPASRSAKIKAALRASRSSFAISRVDPLALACASACARIGRSFLLPLSTLDELLDDLPPARGERLRRCPLRFESQAARPLLLCRYPEICRVLLPFCPLACSVTTIQRPLIFRYKANIPQLRPRVQVLFCNYLQARLCGCPAVYTSDRLLARAATAQKLCQQVAERPLCLRSGRASPRLYRPRSTKPRLESRRPAAPALAPAAAALPVRSRGLAALPLRAVPSSASPL